MTESNQRRWALFLVALLAVTVLVPAPTMAISATTNSTPDAAQVGENVSATLVLTNLYTEAPKAWRLHATTELERATWSVTAYGLDGNELASRSFDGSSFSTPVRAGRDISRIELTVTGTAPMVRNFTYRPKERFVLASFSRTGNQTTPTIIRTWSIHHYTTASRSARQKINATQAAIAEDGGSDELEEQVEFAITAYRHGNFDLAIAIADDAKDTAEDPDYPVGLLSGLFLGGIVVALGTAGIRSYRMRRREDDPWANR